jgi:PPE-repeat protein
MDFALLPPEVNSARMYLGPGSDSMVAAAQAWEGLASELHATANSYRSVTAALTAGPWIGPSSASMTAAANSYVSWLNRAAAQAEEAGARAKAAAGAYEEAFASTVPPQLVAASRALLARLAATNMFGRNTSATAGDGDAPPPRIVVTGIAAKIREITRLRDRGQLSEKDYTELKNRLHGR